MHVPSVGNMETFFKQILNKATITEFYIIRAVIFSRAVFLKSCYYQNTAYTESL
jgi:hypothetical protein